MGIPDYRVLPELYELYELFERQLPAIPHAK